jgi:NitT/TauT family transport system substrate-binding protein
LSENLISRRALLAAGLSAPVVARAASLKPITATFGAMDLAYLPNIVAAEKGFAAANGLDLKLRITEGGPQSRTMVAAGEAQFAHGDTTLPLQLAGKGVATKILLSTEAIAPYANLIVREDLFSSGLNTIDKFAAGKRPDGSRPIVGVSTIGAGTWIWGTFLFEQIGRGSAINFVAGGSSFTMLAALSSGRFDAMMGAPDNAFEAAANKWGQVAFDVTDMARWNALIGGPIPASSVYTLQDTIDRDPAMVQAYTHSLLQALQWLKASSNDDVVSLVRAKYLPNISPASIAYGMDFHRKTMNFSGVIDPEQFSRGSAVWFRRSTGLQPIAFADAVEPRFVRAG